MFTRYTQYLRSSAHPSVTALRRLSAGAETPAGTRPIAARAEDDSVDASKRCLQSTVMANTAAVISG